MKPTLVKNSLVRFLMLMVAVLAGFVCLSSSIFMQQGGTTRFVYDDRGRLRAVIAPSGEVAVYDYDPANNPTAIRRSPAGQPMILTFYAKEGIVADKVTLIGTGFGARVEDDRVLFANGSNGAQARIISADMTQIVVEVPPGTQTGKITVVVPGATLLTAEPFVIVPPVQIMPSPAVAGFGDRVFFRAAVRVNAGDRSVRWAISAGQGNVGSIAQNGVYTAPTLVPNFPPSTVPIVVRATSTAFPDLYAEAPVTVGRVALSPVDAVVKPGDSQQFTADVAAIALPENNKSVSWTVNGIAGGNSTVGTISVTGNYAAPAVIPETEVTVRAISNALPMFFAEARVRLGTLQVTPGELTVGPGNQGQFTATLPASLTDQTVVWSINGKDGGGAGFGSIAGNGVYTAPPTVLTDPITVRATSVVAPSLFGEARVRLGTVSVNAAPSTFVDLGGGFTNPTLTATVNVGEGISKNVVWSVNGILGGGPTLGTITTSGVNSIAFYTPPATLPPVPIVVRATSVALPSLFGEVGLTLGNMRLTPTTVVLAPGQNQRFTADVTLLSGDKRVAWSVNNVVGGNNNFGFISPDGNYFAPLQPGASSVTITATSLATPALTRSAQVLFVSSIQVNPPTAMLILGQSQQFTATVQPSGAPQGVTWSVNDVPGGNASFGTISSAGLYTAPAVLPTVPIRVRATSVTVPSVFGEATVMFTSTTVVVSPQSIPLDVNQGQQFMATVMPPSTSQQVTWTVNSIPGGNATFGTITAAGFYTAPANVPANPTVIIRATSVAVPSAFGEAQVTINSGPPTRPKQ